MLRLMKNTKDLFSASPPLDFKDVDLIIFILTSASFSMLFCPETGLVNTC